MSQCKCARVGMDKPKSDCQLCDGRGNPRCTDLLDDSPPPAGDMPTPAMGRLVYRDYYAGSEPAVIGNMHNVLDERIDSRHVMVDLFQRAGVQDGDEFLISVQRIGPKFPETKFVIGEQGRLMKFTSEKKIILPG
jgi:hypothetical protein